MRDFCIVTVECKDEDQADSIIAAVMQKNLAASAQKRPVENTYYWKGELVTRNEFFVNFKTQSKLFKDINTVIHELHTYSIPEVSILYIDGGSRTYLNWLKSESSKSAPM